MGLGGVRIQHKHQGRKSYFQRKTGTIAKIRLVPINMNLYYKTNVSNMKPLQWQPDTLNKGNEYPEPLQSHTGSPRHPTFITVVQEETRSNGISPVASNSKGNNPNFNERNEFLAFIKVLFRLLKINGENARLHHAKKIVAECALRNRNGNANFVLWKHSVDHRLRAVVGDEYWCQAQRYLDGYKYRRGLLKPSVVSK